MYCVRHCIELFLKETYNNVFYLKSIKEKRSKYKEIKECNKRIIEYDMKILDPLFAKNEEEKITIQHDNKELNNNIQEEQNKISYLWESTMNGLDNRPTHDLNVLCKKVVQIYSVDERIPKKFDFIVNLLKYYKDIDPNGDMFKYLTDNKGQPHFESQKIHTVDLLRVKEQFSYLTKLFEFFNFNLCSIIKEYDTLTYTKHLSRKQIEEISYMLPTPDEFADKIVNVKRNVMDKYGVSSNEFNLVIDLIKSNAEFSMNMGKELELKKISDDTLRILAECAQGKCDFSENFFKISTDEYAALLTYSDICGWRYFTKNMTYYPEDFEYIYEGFRKKNLDCYMLVPKTEINFIIAGMKKCGQKTYATKLEQYMSKQ